MYDTWLTDWGRCGAPDDVPECPCCGGETTDLKGADDDGVVFVIVQLCAVCDCCGCERDGSHPRHVCASCGGDATWVQVWSDHDQTELEAA